jgi:hypothetical protein
MGNQMKKLLAILAMALSLNAYAEASFDQIEMLIQQKNYAAAEAGLEGIIQAHPKSAKAFYAMAQAQAGLGNLEKAQKALSIATGLNPSLDFAPEGSVQKLKQAITPQTANIEAVEESHFWRNVFMILLVVIAAVGGMILIATFRRDEDDKKPTGGSTTPPPPTPGPSKVDTVNSQPIHPTAVATAYSARPAYTGNTSTVSSTPTATQPTHTTIVNNTSSNDGLLTGILIGDMMSHHHDTTRVVEREVIREVPAPVRDTSWDDIPTKPARTSWDEIAPSKSSSWDDDSSSSKKSSSWDSDSSSSLSSSWSSSSSDSSSSWDSSSSDSSSSSSWD